MAESTTAQPTNGASQNGAAQSTEQAPAQADSLEALEGSPENFPGDDWLSEEQKVNGQPKRYSKAELEAFAAEKRKLDAANERFREAAQERKKAEELYQKLEEQRQQLEQYESRLRPDTLDDFLRARGIDPVQWADQRIQRELQIATMDPEQRAQLQVEWERQQLEQERQSWQDQQIEAQINQQAVHELYRFDKEISKAIEDGSLRRSPGALHEVIRRLEAQIAAGQDPDVNRAIKLATEDFSGAFRDHAEALEAEELASALGTKNLEKIRKWFIQKVKASVPEEKAPPSRREATPSTGGQQRRYLTPDEWKATV